MDINDNIELPFELKISFDKLLRHYEEVAKGEDDFLVDKAKLIIDVSEKTPLLRNGFSELKYLEEYKEEIRFILQDSFSDVLGSNEIKTASVPFHSLIFNSSKRFQNIIKDAGKDFELKVINMPEDMMYVIGCTIILKYIYGYDMDFKRPFFYEIPDRNGHLRKYKILYNADFTDIIKKEDTPEITESDFFELLDNFNNIELWRKKFPPNGYIFKGFVINNMFDVTIDNAISDIKATLIESNKRKSDNFIEDFQETFRSLFNIHDIEVGFVVYDKSNDAFEKVIGKGINSYLLFNKSNEACKTALCSGSYETILKNDSYFSVSDVDRFYDLSNGEAQYRTLNEQGIKSAVFAPISYQGELMGVLELVSKTPKALNSINANKLVDVMPFIVSSVLRSKEEEENLVKAVIQQECTSIHSSVYWKFEESARQFLKDKQQNGDRAVFGEVVFNDIYPLFGQMDVKGSSNARNIATEKDLSMQLNYVSKILDDLNSSDPLPIYEQLLYQLNEFSDELKEEFKVDSE
ncbi:MAG: GAF domain-containing protein, partial [Bacteroidota bacterium]